MTNSSDSEPEIIEEEDYAPPSEEEEEEEEESSEEEEEEEENPIDEDDLPEDDFTDDEDEEEDEREDDEDVEYVSDIRRKRASRAIELLVKCQGEDEPSWERANIVCDDAPHAVEVYLSSLTKRDGQKFILADIVRKKFL